MLYFDVYFIEDFMKSFREIDLSIHTLLDKPVETVKTTAEDILEQYKQQQAAQEQQDSQGRIRFT